MVSGDLLKRLRITLGNVSVPEHMHGDNLAILLASFYEDAEGEVDDNGWTETAIQAAQKTLDAIHAHYADRIEALQDQLAEAKTVDAHPNSWAGLIAERDALQAKLAIEENTRDQWRSMWEKEQTDNEHLQAQLADAREDALREAAGAITSEINKRHYLGVLRHRDRKDLKFIRERILALIDTPTPAQSPDDLVKASLEWAAEILSKVRISPFMDTGGAAGHQSVGRALADAFRTAGADPATIKTIIERAKNE
jgi:hypothetical protein